MFESAIGVVNDESARAATKVARASCPCEPKQSEGLVMAATNCPDGRDGHATLMKRLSLLDAVHHHPLVFSP